MPKLDSLSNVLLTMFYLLLDALGFIRVSLRPRCALVAEEPLPPQAIDFVPGAQGQSSSGERLVVPTNNSDSVEIVDVQRPPLVLSLPCEPVVSLADYPGLGRLDWPFPILVSM